MKRKTEPFPEEHPFCATPAQTQFCSLTNCGLPVVCGPGDYGGGKSTYITSIFIGFIRVSNTLIIMTKVRFKVSQSMYDIDKGR